MPAVSLRPEDKRGEIGGRDQVAHALQPGQRGLLGNGFGEVGHVMSHAFYFAWFDRAAP